MFDKIMPVIFVIAHVGGFGGFLTMVLTSAPTV